MSITQDERDRFADTGSFVDGPNMDDLRLDFISPGQGKSAWNKQVANLFAKDYLDEHGGVERETETVTSAFWTTFKTLKRNYAEQVTNSQPQTRQQEATRRLKQQWTNVVGRQHGVSL